MLLHAALQDNHMGLYNKYQPTGNEPGSWATKKFEQHTSELEYKMLKSTSNIRFIAASIS